jgi:hypothetical protein
MNTSPVVSLQAVSDALLPYRTVKMTAAGVDYAGPYDRAIGVILPGDLNRDYPSVQIIGILGEAVLGNATPVVMGDELEQSADGKLVKLTTGEPVAVALEGATTADEDQFEVVYYAAPKPPAAPST